MNPAAQTECEFWEEGRNGELCSPMLSFPRTDADLIFHLAQEEPGPAPAGSFKEHSKCYVRRAHFCSELDDPGPAVKRLSFIG